MLVATVLLATMCQCFFVAPDFDRSSWLNVKETLGMQFPNVSVRVVCVCMRTRPM